MVGWGPLVSERNALVETKVEITGAQQGLCLTYKAIVLAGHGCPRTKLSSPKRVSRSDAMTTMK